jgi:hypothetical protein
MELVEEITQKFVPENVLTNVSVCSSCFGRKSSRLFNSTWSEL